jgi:hypothetical protein
MSTGYPSNRISMRSGSACKVISLPCPNVADRQLTRCEPFSMRSSTCCAPAAHGAISPPTFHRGRPSSPISGVCASKGPGRSCYGRCTALDANNKEGILTQVPPAWMRHPRENGRGVVWDLWLRCPQTHQRGETAHPRGYGSRIPISIYVTPADTHNTRGARCLLAGSNSSCRVSAKIWADAASARAGVS